MYLSRSFSKMVLIAFIILLCVSFSELCFAQSAYLPWIPNTTYSYFPVFPFYNPYVPSIATLQGYVPPLPFSIPAPIPSFSSPRIANATIITIPTATNTVTAYAPLGTLNLTPSTLVFLLLYFTLH
jgi:hypothetical protein